MTYEIIIQNGISYLLGPPVEDGTKSLIASFLINRHELAQSVCDTLNAEAAVLDRIKQHDAATV
jgi:hypothetical protein